MIVRDLKRVGLLLTPLALLLLLSASLWHSHPDYLRSQVGALLGQDGSAGAPWASGGGGGYRKPRLTANETHYEIFSESTPDGKYFEIRFDDKDVFNPNIVPHPKWNNTWHVVGRQWNNPEDPDAGRVWYASGCLAQFIKGELMCITNVRPLPVEPTTGDKCSGKWAPLAINVGPHDARVFMGPQSPLIMYGSNSGVTCFGQWVQDFRKLTGWEYELLTNTDFPLGTEIIRPPPYSPLEKNYFLFWDRDKTLLVHWNIYPKRGFATLQTNGHTGADLAPKTTQHDEACLQRYLPKLPEELESIHQATNSLKITLCNRSDPKCTPTDANTFILSIIQHKTYYAFHGEYEPYAVLFHQRAPYELYAISKKPLWISGRGRGRGGRRTDMFYVTSVNWKERGVKYHGYLDDVVMLGFGVEDRTSGGIDVRAGDLLVDMGLCAYASVAAPQEGEEGEEKVEGMDGVEGEVSG